MGFTLRCRGERHDNVDDAEPRHPASHPAFPGVRMTAAKPFSWEAALVPCWGWIRGVPLARGLSVPFPFLVGAIVDTERAVSWADLALAYAVVSAGYGVVYGYAGPWMLARARSARNATRDAAPPTLGRGLVNVLGTGLLLAINVSIVSLSTSPTARHAAQASAMKASLRMLVEAQDAYHATHGRYAISLDSLQFEAASSASRVTLVHADSASWAAEVANSENQQRCRISVGGRASVPADSLHRQPVCDPLPGFRIWR